MAMSRDHDWMKQGEEFFHPGIRYRVWTYYRAGSWVASGPDGMVLRGAGGRRRIFRSAQAAMDAAEMAASDAEARKEI